MGALAQRRVLFAIPLQAHQTGKITLEVTGIRGMGGVNATPAKSLRFILHPFSFAATAPTDDMIPPHIPRAYYLNAYLTSWMDGGVSSPL
ncbi:hypothetical protein AVEN_253582-1 [Araneus ventricosus]|uniref:Uncharacterized protein n=1 Tax=Araneus ventricosus TaxID=182803 RepID=A0A4Y2KRM9_ARAVE|nr:hypothetical protein AVEN_99306-1 [Araneus ventricosus]GBN04326.1 hypothetical protein AVEN_253582-1 [Araneus ventricosus]